MAVVLKLAKVNPENGPKDPPAGTLPPSSFRLERFL